MMRVREATAGLLLILAILHTVAVRQARANGGGLNAKRGAPEVTPDSGNTAMPTLGSSRNAVVFAVKNTGSQTEQYAVQCFVEGGVTSCSLNSSSITVPGGQTIQVPVWYEMTGVGRVVLDASTGTASDRGRYDIAPKSPMTYGLQGGQSMSLLGGGGGGNQQPLVYIYPAVGYYTSPVNVIIQWCGTEPGVQLDPDSRWVKRNGSSITSNFTFNSTTIAGCADAYESTGSFNVNSSSGDLLTTWICYLLAEEETPPPGPSSSTVLTTDCGGNGMYYFHGTTPAPVVEIASVNAGSRLSRPDCVISGAGPAAAFQCGDLIVTHSMPAFKALNKDQTLTLLYNSSTAKVQPVIMANVYVPNGGLQWQPVNANAFNATLAVDGVTVPQAFNFALDSIGSGTANSRRLAVSYDGSALETGVHPYSLAVTATYDTACSNCTTTVNGDLIVVNRVNSPFGAGWSLTGIEQIYPGQRNGALLLVEGDGSAYIYEAVDSIGSVPVEWQAPPGSYRDRIYRDSAYSDSIYYYRKQLDGTRIDYNIAGRQTWVRSRSGQKAQYSYASNTSASALLNYIQIAPHASGKRYEFKYTSGVLDSIIDPGGRALQGTVSSGKLTDLRNPGDTIAIEFAYANGLMSSRATSRTDVTTTVSYTYVSRTSQLASATMPPIDGESAILSFKPVQSRGLWQGSDTARMKPDSASVIVDGPMVGDSAIIMVNGSGAPIKITDPMGSTVQILRDSASMPALTTRVTRNGCRITRLSWNPNATVAEVVDSTSSAGCGSLVTAPKTTTTVTYSSTFPDKVSQIIRPDGTQTSYTYFGEPSNPSGAPGAIRTVTAPNGHVTRFSHYTSGAAQGLPEYVIEDSVETWIGWGIADAATDQKTAFEYDTSANLVRTLTYMGSHRQDTVRYDRDSMGRVEAAFDQDGHETSYQYYPDNNFRTVARHSSGDSIVTKYHHSFVGLDSIVDPRGVKRSYQYDALGQLRAELDEAGVAETHKRNLAGLIDTTVTRNGAIISMTYDKLGRLVQRTWPARTQSSSFGDGSVVVAGDTENNFYSVHGWLDSVKTNNWAIVRTHRADGLVSREIQRKANGTQPITHSFTYDSAGRREAYRIGSISVDSMADSIGYKYNGEGELTRITARWRGTYIRKDSVSFTWDALGRRKLLTYHLGDAPMTVTYAYDMAGNFRRLCGSHSPVEGTSVFNLVLRNEVERDGRIASRTSIDTYGDCNGPVGGFLETNTYDDLHQLIEQDHGNSYHHYYKYDASGNMTRDSSTSGLFVATIDSASNRLDRWGIQNAFTTKSYEYDQSGARLSQLTVESGNAAFYGSLKDRLYAYDALGRTTGYQPFDYDLMYEEFVRLPAVETACSYGPDSQLWIHCSYGLGKRLGYDGNNIVRTGMDGQLTSWTFVHAPGVDEPLMGSVNGTLYAYYYWVTDGNGRRLAVGDLHGADKKPGALDSQLDDGDDPGAITEPGFAASRTPSAAMPGISFFRNRLYDQETGRWTQEDPIGAAGGINLYAYAGNNPVTYTDPFGLCERPGDPKCSKWIVAGAAVGASAGTVIASGCTVTTGGLCVAGAPAIVTAGVGLGAAAGSLVGTLNPSDIAPAAMGTVRGWLRGLRDAILIGGGLLTGDNTKKRPDEIQEDPTEILEPVKPAGERRPPVKDKRGN